MAERSLIWMNAVLFRQALYIKKICKNVKYDYI